MKLLSGIAFCFLVALNPIMAEEGREGDLQMQVTELPEDELIQKEEFVTDEERKKTIEEEKKNKNSQQFEVERPKEIIP